MTQLSKSQLWAIYDKVPLPVKLLEETTSTGQQIHYVNWMDTYVLAQNPNKETSLNVEWEYLTDDYGNDAWFFPDETAEVKIAIRIEGVTHQASLPVMDKDFVAIVSPNSTQINKSKMRVRCKALGEMGLFWRLWSEDERPNVGAKVSNVLSLVPANDEAVIELTDAEKVKSYMDGVFAAAKADPPLTLNGLEVKIKQIEKGLTNRGLVDKNFKRRMNKFRKDLAPLMGVKNV